jgi:glyoxylase-like metal-dependent hydrolase (beta-lactamase superfamily II)
MFAPLLDARAIGAAQAPSFREIRPGVGVFVGPGGTIGWLAARDGLVMVDSQFPATARQCFAELGRRGAGPAVLFNTHHHGDHVAGNEVLRSSVARIVQHERCAARTKGADTTFTGRWSTTVGGERVEARHYGAAHTDGDISVMFQNAGVVHLGDLVFNGVPPFVDRASGASMRNWVLTLELIARDYAGATFVFGHGRADAVIGTVRDVLRFRDYLSAALDHVERGIAAGHSREEITALTALPGFEDAADVVKNYVSPNPLFTLRHVLTAAHEELGTR